MNEVTIQVELDGTEFDITFSYEHSYQPAKLSGAWEDCYPEEEEFEWEIIEQPYWLNAIESWELLEIDEDVFWDAAMNDIASCKQDYGDYLYDQMRDDLIMDDRFTRS